MNELQKITARMLQIENVNMKYNEQTNFGKNPNGQEKEIEKILAEWDALKVQRNILKQSGAKEVGTIKAGSIITARSICDHNCIFKANVISRNGSFVTLKFQGNVVKKKVKIDSDGNEYVMASGSYSMAPVFR